METGQWFQNLVWEGTMLVRKGRKGDSFIKYCSMPGVALDNGEGVSEALLSSEGFCVEVQQCSRP